jgi:hypothetical protein
VGAPSVANVEAESVKRATAEKHPVVAKKTLAKPAAKAPDKPVAKKSAAKTAEKPAAKKVTTKRK